jgi:hypothetical protein
VREELINFSFKTVSFTDVAEAAPADLHWRAFVQEHRCEVSRTFRSAASSITSDTDGEADHRLAIAYKGKLEEHQKNGGQVGAASRRWSELLWRPSRDDRPGAQAPLNSRGK